jgi:hypothetical protein
LRLIYYIKINLIINLIEINIKRYKIKVTAEWTWTSIRNRVNSSAGLEWWPPCSLCALNRQSAFSHWTSSPLGCSVECRCTRLQSSSRFGNRPRMGLWKTKNSPRFSVLAAENYQRFARTQIDSICALFFMKNRAVAVFVRLRFGFRPNQSSSIGKTDLALVSLGGYLLVLFYCLSNTIYLLKN